MLILLFENSITTGMGTYTFQLLRISPLKLRMTEEEEEKGADLVEHDIDKMLMYTAHIQNHIV